MKIAVLGLGIIGSRAAANLQECPDHQTRLWNRTPKGLEDENSDLSKVVEDAEVILLYLRDGSAVREVVSRLFSLCSGQPIIINHSTVDLETTQWLTEACSARNWGFLDAPFTGSRDAAANGSLVYYVAGDGKLCELLTPIMLTTGREIINCGDSCGRATIIKLVTNLVSACTVQALAEAQATAVHLGIEAETFAAAIASNACGSALAAMKLPTMATGDFQPHFSLQNMLKDSRYVLKLASELDTPAIEAVSKRMAELCDAGFAEKDYSSLASPYLNS